MKIEARVIPPKGKEKFWSVEIPALAIHTQGKSKKDAFTMAKDAIESLINVKGFEITCEPTGENGFLIGTNNLDVFVPFILRRIRMAHNLTAREVAKRLNSNSPNTYARYEQGKATPTLKKLEELLKAIDPTIEPILRFGT